MNDLQKQLEEAQNQVARLEQLIKFTPCSEVGHRWVFLGGKNAGCSEDCSCSVPVHECSVCGDCDYGDNEWSEETIMECQNET